MVYGLLWEDFAVLEEVKTASDSEYKIGKSLRKTTQTKVKDLCSRFGMR